MGSADASGLSDASGRAPRRRDPAAEAPFCAPPPSMADRPWSFVTRPPSTRPRPRRMRRCAGARASFANAQSYLRLRDTGMFRTATTHPGQQLISLRGDRGRCTEAASSRSHTRCPTSAAARAPSASGSKIGPDVVREVNSRTAGDPPAGSARPNRSGKMTRFGHPRVANITVRPGSTALLS